MADFCTICHANLFGDLESEFITEENVLSLLTTNIINQGPDIDLVEGYNDWIKPELEKYKNEPNMFLSFGICEGCASIGLCVNVIENKTYLSLIRLMDYENQITSKYNIALIKEDLELEWDIDGIKKVLTDEVD